MPIYEYQCQACGSRTEIIQKFSDPSPSTCPDCKKGPLKKVLSSPAGLVFKGSGFYATDYARKKKEPKEGGKDQSKAPEGEAKGTSGEVKGPSKDAPATPPKKTD